MTMAESKRTGVRRLVYALGYSINGIRAAWKNEAAFREEIVLCAVMAPLGIWLGKTAVERILLLGSLMLILIVELLNSAVEALADRIGMEHHVLSGRAKDLGSAAVLISLAAAALAWGGIAFGRIFG